jgi:hypothetical protein
MVKLRVNGQEHAMMATHRCHCSGICETNWG